MQKVGFLINFNIFKWFGGTYLIKNLIECINTFSDNDLEPIIIIKKKLTKNELKEFKNFKLLKTNFFINQSVIERIYHKFLIIFFGKSKKYDNFFLKNNIKILSHSNALSNSFFLGSKSEVKSLPFLADLQYLHYPNNFTLKNILFRKISIFMCAMHSTKIILSSNDVKNDLKKVSIRAYNKSIVNPFIFKSPDRNKIININKIKKKYNLPDKYFFLPNQYWRHKNHYLVLKALSYLKKNNKIRNLCIVSTGSSNEHRDIKYFSKIKKFIKDHELTNCYKYLGTVSFKEVMTLMYYSIAVIQPSKFEGRSSSVEQARSIGKKIILTNIKIHKEQKPLRAKYFSPNNYRSLSSILLDTLKNHNLNIEKKYINYAKKQNKIEFYKYYKSYLDIIKSIE
jgi:hypothetical protein